MSRWLTPNTPLKRLEYIAKLYGERTPGVVLETFMALADMVGFEHPTQVGAMSRWDNLRDRPVRRVPATPSHRLRQEREILAQLLEEVRDDPRMRRGHGGDALWPWVARWLASSAKDDPRHGRMPWVFWGNRLRWKGAALALWQRQERADLGKYTIDEALAALEGFEVARLDVPQGDVVYQWPDGWTVQRLDIFDVNPDEEPETYEEELTRMLAAEGEAMQHCVGEYVDAVTRGTAVIYSLRNHAGRPHVTIEYDPKHNYVRQVMGKQNRDPLPEYQVRVDEFLTKGLETRVLTQQETDMLGILQRFGNWATGDDPINVLGDWLWADPLRAADWLDAGFWDGDTARALDEKGVRPRTVLEMPDPVRLFLLEGGDWELAKIAERIGDHEDDLYEDMDRAFRLARRWRKAGFDFDAFEEQWDEGVTDPDHVEESE